MSVLQRAWYALCRKKVRSVVLAAFFVLVLMCLNVCMAMLRTTDQLSEHFSRTAHAALTLELHNQDDTFTDGDIQALISAIEPARLFAQLRTTAQLSSATPVLERQLVQRDDVDAATLAHVTVYGCNDIARHSLFRSGAFMLTEGRFPTSNEQNAVMVHQEFAQHNQLSCGMTLHVRSNASDASQAFTIVGIFSGKRHERFTGAPSDASENTLFMSLDDAQRVGTGVAALSSGAPARAESAHRTRMTSLDIAPAPGQTLQQLKDQLTALPLDTAKFFLRDAGENFESVRGSLDAVSMLVRAVLAAVLAGSFVILLLVLVLWLRQRITEIGILLAIGNSKRSVCAQVLLEMVLVSLPSALIAFALVHVFARSAVTQLLGWAESFGEAATSSAGAGTSLAGGGVASSTDALQSLFLQHTDASAVVLAALGAYALALVVLALAVGVSSLIFMRKKPRELLVQMS